MRLLIHVALWPLPWTLRRRLLVLFFGYEIDPQARIGFSVVAPSKLRMSAGAKIGHLNMIKGMDLLEMERGAGISRLNWIYGIPHDAPYFPSQPGRVSEFIIEEGGGITSRHLVDCTNVVRVGPYALVAGCGTQILTHSIDMSTNQQSSKPILIGPYCMVGTRSVLLGGAVLPGCSALGAGSVLRNAFEATHMLYSGVPAQPSAPLSPSLSYFTHETPGVHGARLKTQ